MADTNLAELDERLAEVRDQLHAQQDLIPDIACGQTLPSLVKMLSNGLRLYLLLKQHRASLIALSDQ